VRSRQDGGISPRARRGMFASSIVREGGLRLQGRNSPLRGRGIGLQTRRGNLLVHGRGNWGAKSSWIHLGNKSIHPTGLAMRNAREPGTSWKESPEQIYLGKAPQERERPGNRRAGRGGHTAKWESETKFQCGAGRLLA